MQWSIPMVHLWSQPFHSGVEAGSLIGDILCTRNAPLLCDLMPFACQASTPASVKEYEEQLARALQLSEKEFERQSQQNDSPRESSPCCSLPPLEVFEGKVRFVTLHYVTLRVITLCYSMLCIASISFRMPSEVQCWISLCCMKRCCLFRALSRLLWS